MNAASPELPQDAGSSPCVQALLRRMTLETPGVLSLEFEAQDGALLPEFQPGAHIDFYLPDGAIRQYSLCGDPKDRGRWRIAVRDIKGGRASRFIHRGELKPGGIITLGLPRNNFVFEPAERYLFVAGGIGITPLLPMLRAASESGRAWTLLFCARSSADAPFLEEARALGGEVVLHASRDGSRLDVTERLREAQPGTLLYCCGPDALMSAVEEATSAWPQGSVRFEWFKPRSFEASEASGDFEVVCAQSGTSVTVSEGRSILETLHEAGVSVPCSCEQGVCGTCEVAVLEGEIEHRDSILSSAERASNRTMMVCVSRAKISRDKSPRLVLDL